MIGIDCDDRIDSVEPGEYRPGGRTRETRVQAPFGRRVAPVIVREQYGPYVVLRCQDPGGPLPQAGQFYMLTAGRRWGGGESERPYLPRAFSVLRATEPASGPIELAFVLEDVGPGTNRLCELAAGDQLLLVGPLGAGFRPAREGRRPLLVGGGVGIAPLAIWRDTLGVGSRVLLGFRGASHAEGAVLIPGAQVATDLLETELDSSPGSEIYACGPPPMLEAVRAICADRGIPAQLALESGMACGFGACFGCVVPTRDGYVRLCVEGPVLDAGSLDSVLVGHGAGH